MRIGLACFRSFGLEQSEADSHATDVAIRIAPPHGLVFRLARHVKHCGLRRVCRQVVGKANRQV
jgi:hypothetical protein